MNDVGAFRLERHDDVAAIVFDVPGERVNILREGFDAELGRILDDLVRDPNLRGVVLASAKRDSFVAGADVDLLRRIDSIDEAMRLSRDAQRAMDHLAELKLPVVAAIHGSCLGGGLELAMACHARVASNHPATRLGQPEVQLGIIPGAGGTQRLPRLVGLEEGLQLILTGMDISATRAKRIGLVDEVVDPSILVDVAVGLARRLGHGEPTGNGRRPPLVRRLRTQLLEDNPTGRRVVFRQAEARVRERTHGNLPAPLRALEVVRSGIESGVEAGLEAEARAFGELAVTSHARNLLGLFHSRQELRREARALAADARGVRKVGVIGAGLMGAGIAGVTAARAGIPVRLKDLDAQHLRMGLRSIYEYLTQRVERGRISEHERDRLMSLVQPTTEYTGFGRVDLVIEAVVEDVGVKHSVIKEIERVTGPDVIFATNTSSIPIETIADGHSRPELVLGMHYFSPVPQVPLLEVVRGRRTADWVLATAVEIGRRQDKVVIVVNDGPGFYTSRILAPYVNEAAHLLTEGVRVDTLDRLFVDAGFPVGPFRLVDEVGIDVAAKISRVLQEGFGERMAPPPAFDAVMEDERFGKKNARGFYYYERRNGDVVRTGEVDATIYELIDYSTEDVPDEQEIVDRGLLRMVNEAAWAFGDGIVRSPRDGDAGAVFGLGFPPYLGGPFSLIDARGAVEIVERLRQFAARHGERFAVAPRLEEVAEAGAHFYAREPKGSA